MRSHLICDALNTVRSRFLLCHATVKATRKFHSRGARIQETMNQVLARFANGRSTEKLIRPLEKGTDARGQAA